jgi:hypothetical protein
MEAPCTNRKVGRVTAFIGVAKRRHPSKVTGIYSKASVLPSLGFGPERKPITFWLI